MVSVMATCPYVAARRRTWALTPPSSGHATAGFACRVMPLMSNVSCRMSGADLLPTFSKDKLPSGLSYPLGAEELSEFLWSVPEASNYRVRFLSRAIFRHSKWQEVVRREGELTVLRIERSFDRESWEVFVYALPSNRRQVVRSALQSEVFPRLAAWLKRAERHSFEAHAELQSATVRIEEYLRVDS